MFKNVQNNSLMLTGMNTAGLVTLLAYTVKTFNEINSSLEDIRFEVDSLKSSLSENNKRTNVVFTRLNEKIDQKVKQLKSHEPVIQEMSRLRVKEEPQRKLIELDEDFITETPVQEKKEDEISDAIAELMGSQ